MELISNNAGEIDVFSAYEKKDERKEDRFATVEIYNAFWDAFKFYNYEFYGGKLPDCIITLQRRRNTYGYFWGDKFADTKDAEMLRCEIAMNPTLMAGRSDEYNLSTLVHEMSHHWQFHFSAYACRRGVVRPYHDKEWGSDMKRIGLPPSDTGEPGGNETGTRMSHYIESGGWFQRATRELLETGFSLKWADNPELLSGGTRELKVKKKDQSKRNFKCPVCQQNAWANFNAKLKCGNFTCGGVPMMLN